MTESSFETHEAIRTLQGAGFEAVQAQAVVDVVTRAPISTQVVKDLERIKVQVETNMATKTDLAVLERVVAQVETNMATKTDLAVLERVVAQVETNMATKADLAVLERVVAQLETNMATKADLANLRGELTSDLANLRGELTSGIADLRASLFRALWLQGGAYAALIIGLAGLVAAGS